MRLRGFAVTVAALLFSLVSAARAAAPKTDVYFGYSRVGANLYSPNTPGMNGWQFAMHVKPMPFVGIEGDVSHYSQTVNDSSQHVTTVMFGPRVTVHTAGLSLFAHALAGLAHQNETVTTYGSAGYDAASYTLGAGADVPLLLGFKLRVTGDYLGNSKAPSSPSPSHYRFGVGVAYHF